MRENTLTAEHPDIRAIEKTIRENDPSIPVHRPSLEQLMVVGAQLHRAKSLLRKGQFAPWAEAQFGYRHQWRANLMKLAAANSSGELEKARQWAKANGDRRAEANAVNEIVGLIKAYAKKDLAPANVSRLSSTELLKTIAELEEEVKDFKNVIEEKDEEIAELQARLQVCNRPLNEFEAERQSA
jgi:hypothetical protein